MKTLNKQQTKAVNSPLGKNLINSGAGTGKTTVLIERILHLIHHYNIRESKIWVITFTNKTIEEIKIRLARNNIGKESFIHVGTFHSSLIEFLREYIHLLGGTPDFRVMSTSDQTSTLKPHIDHHLHLFKTPNGKVNWEHIRNHLSIFRESYLTQLSQGEFISKLDTNKKMSFLNLKALKKDFSVYLKRTRQEGLIDFDEILYSSYELLLKHPETLKYWTKHLDALLIDEFQDLNTIQFNISELISSASKELFCVGDPNQTIYGWRGSDPDIFHKFAKKHKNCNVIRLNENYRSTQKILDVANTLMNDMNIEFRNYLTTNNPPGEKPIFFEDNYLETQGSWIMKNIRRLVAEGASYRDFAVLFRCHIDALFVEKQFSDMGIKYKKLKGTKFLDRSEIKLVNSYLNLVFNNDLPSLEIVLLGIPGIGLTFLNKFRNYSIEHEIDFWTCLKMYKEFALSAKQMKRVEMFVETICWLKSLSGEKSFLSLFEKLDEKLGILHSISGDGDESKIENVEFFLNTLEESLHNEKAGITIEEILRENALTTNGLDDGEDSSMVTFSTIHSAKGLEFPYVFVIQMAEGKFPSNKKESKDIEGERRLAYVAFTRAQKQLFISYSTKSFSSTISTDRVVPSRFVESSLHSGALVWYESPDVFRTRKMVYRSW